MKIYLISGGELDLNILEKTLEKRNPNDQVIAIDHGVDGLIAIGVMPDYLLGDFDSLNPQNKTVVQQHGAIILPFNPHKDETDTQLGLTLANQLALESVDKDKIFVLLGTTGRRIDHSLANLHLLFAPHQATEIEVIDRHNRMRPMVGPVTLSVEASNYTYVSVLPISGKIEGLTLTGFEYPLTEATVERERSLTVSNRLLDLKGQVSLMKGQALLIESCD